MAKTNAERQKAYRERKKKTDPEFMKRERERAKINRKPAEKLSRQQHVKRLEMNKIYCRTYRLKKSIGNMRQMLTIDKQPQEQQINTCRSISSATELHRSPETPVASTSGIALSSNSSEKLLVALPFVQRKPSATRRTNAKSLTKARLKIKELNNKLKTEQRAKKRWQKKCHRLQKTQRIQTPNVQTDDQSTSISENRLSTPRTKTRLELRAAGIEPNRSRVNKQLFRKMTLTNCLIDEIKASRQANNSVKKRKQIKTFFLMKKYRCMHLLNKETGICRKKLANMPDTTKVLTRTEILRTTLRAKKIRKEIEQFYLRDDVSRCMPGKKDATKVDGQKIQTRILNDYLHNLHGKFTSENPDAQVSYSLFCRLRPKYVKLTSLLSRNTCLCTVHQNMALKLKSLRNCKLDVSPNPEVTARTTTYEEMEKKLGELTLDEIEYEEWQRVEADGKKRMRVIKNNKPLAEFKQKMMIEFGKFLEHCSRVHAQYTALHTLKGKLPENRAVIQMDFAENYSCQSTDEIQSAYWNATAVTIHPVVVYYKQDGILKHKNFSFISDVTHHNTAAVLAIIKKLMPIVLEMLPKVEIVHYWTDSPSSQYRNRNIFHLVTKHHDMFGIAASWDFFEAGHGKSVCDGVGGACKRMASEAVKQGKVSIQDGTDFYRYAHDNEKSISYVFYAQDDYDKAVDTIAQMNAKAVNGTMKLHAVRCEEGRLLSRTTSCYCDVCMSGHCDTWTIHELNNKTDADQGKKDCTEVVPYIRKGNFVVAIYDNEWYIGEIIDTDETDKTAEINFMNKRVHNGRTQFSWPSRKDVLWVEYSDILMEVQKPLPIDRFQRFFAMSCSDLENIMLAYN